MPSLSPSTENAAYERPPRHWPIAPLGRNAFLILGLALLALTLLPFWGSIAVAGVFALGLSQPMAWFTAKLRGRRKTAAGLAVSVLMVAILFPFSAFTLRVYQQVSAPNKEEGKVFSSSTITQITGAYEKLEAFAVKYGVGARLFESSADVREALRQGATNALSAAASLVPNLVASLPEIFLTFLVFGLFLYAFLAYPRQLKRFAFRLRVFRPTDLRRAIQILKISSYNSLVSNFLVGMIQASIITIGARAVGFRESPLIFSVVFAISYIPFIGAAPVGYVLALVSLLTDSVSSALVLSAVATFAGIVDNVVRPYLVANGETEVHPILSFASILGAIAIFGIKGIFLGPVILIATVSLLGWQPPREKVKSKPAQVRSIRRKSALKKSS